MHDWAAHAAAMMMRRLPQFGEREWSQEKANMVKVVDTGTKQVSKCSHEPTSHPL